MFSLLDFTDFDSALAGGMAADGLGHLTLFILFLMLSTIIVLAVTSSRSFSHFLNFRAAIPFLRQIYIPVKYRLAPKSYEHPPIFQKNVLGEPSLAHLYTLNDDTWTFFTSEACPIGSPMRFFLSSMPQASQELGVVDGVVTSCRSDKGEGYIVSVQIVLLRHSTVSQLKKYFAKIFPERIQPAS